MIKVKIVLESAITHKETLIGEMTIANNAGGTRDRGNYNVAVARKNSWAEGFGRMIRNPLRTGRVDNYPRLSYNVWRLVVRAILAAFPEEAKNGRDTDDNGTQLPQDTEA